ncbi:hypothetical protein RB213_001691 [Colletotrichum asianum]
MVATTRSASLRPQDCSDSPRHRRQRINSQSQKPDDETASTLLDQLQALESLVAKGSSCRTFKGNSEKILSEAATCCEITAAAMGDFETMIQNVLPESSYEIHVRPLGGPPFLPYV